MGAGAMLAKARAERGMTIVEIAAQLRYSPKQIEALECDDYARLPGNTIVRGMIRGYSKILGTNAQPILQALDLLHVSPPAAVDLRATRVPFPDGKARSTKVYVWLCIAIGTAVAGVVYEWNFDFPQYFTSEVPSIQVEQAPVDGLETSVGNPDRLADSSIAVSEKVPDGVPEVASTLASPPPHPSGPVSAMMVRLRFDFTKEAWVEVKDRDGRTLTAQTNPPGARVIVDGLPPFALIIGNATNVQLTYGEKPIDLAQHIKLDVARFTLN